MRGFRILYCRQTFKSDNPNLWSSTQKTRYGQRNGWCSSDREVGQKQLYVLGVQDARVHSRAWLLVLHPGIKQSSTGINTQGISDLGTRSKQRFQSFVLHCIPCQWSNIGLHSGCEDAKGGLGKFEERFSSRVPRPRSCSSAKSSTISDKGIWQWPTTPRRSRISAMP